MRLINLKIFIVFLISQFCCSLGIKAQLPTPCFGPDPAVHPVLYVSNPDCPDHHPDFDVALVGLTNFLPILDGFAGNWVIDPTSTVVASFANDPVNPGNTLNNGSTASIDVTSLAGGNTLVITNTVDGFNPPTFPVGTCTQTYEIECFESAITDNPPLPEKCPIKVLLLLDESGSINESGITPDVELAVNTLATELGGGGVEMAIIEFESLSRPVPILGSTGFQPVDAAYIAGVNTYLTNPSGLGLLGNGDSNPQDANSYTPGEEVDLFIGGTNWEAALLDAIAIGGADIVILFTDGNPTFYNDPIAGATGEGDVLDMTALVQARDAANTLKSAGSHLFFLGIGNVLRQPIIESTGSESYVLGSTAEEFCTADYFLLSEDCTDIMGCMEEMAGHINAKQTCVFDLALVKSLNVDTPGPFEPGGTVTFDITIINQGTVDAFNVGVTDMIPSGLTLADPNWLLVGTNAILITPIPVVTAGNSELVSITFTIDADANGTLINDAEISSADDDMDPNNDPILIDIDSTPGDDSTPDDLANNDDVLNMTGGDDQDPEQITISQVAIPTMGEWGLICLFIVLLIVGVNAIREKSLSLAG